MAIKIPEGMKVYECTECEEVMAIKCTMDIEHCPDCGMVQSLVPTDKPVPDDAALAEDWEHEQSENYDGCGAVYSVLSAGCTEYCPNCNGQNG